MGFYVGRILPCSSSCTKCCLKTRQHVGRAQCSPSGGCQILYANSKPSSDVSRPGVKLVQRGPQFALCDTQCVFEAAKHKKANFETIASLSNWAVDFCAVQFNHQS